jgi:multidrug efflux system membrane fusion protein
MRQINSLFIFSWLLFFSVHSFAAEINAKLDWSDLRRLGTTVSGKVTQVNVRPGVVVEKDTVLVELDQRFFKVNQERTRAERRAALLQLEEALREQDRAIELYDRTVISDYERQQADIQLSAARAKYAHAQAEYERAKLEQEYSLIVSPYDAVIISVDTAIGEVVVNENESRVLVEVARADQMLSLAEVSSEQVAGVNVDDEIEVAFRGKWQDGQVDSITPLKPGADQKYLLSVRFAVSPEAAARSGESSAIRLPD